jgi:hypothetical protein
MELCASQVSPRDNGFGLRSTLRAEYLQPVGANLLRVVEKKKISQVNNVMVTVTH